MNKNYILVIFSIFIGLIIACCTITYIIYFSLTYISHSDKLTFFSTIITGLGTITAIFLALISINLANKSLKSNLMKVAKEELLDYEKKVIGLFGPPENAKENAKMKFSNKAIFQKRLKKNFEVLNTFLNLILYFPDSKNEILPKIKVLSNISTLEEDEFFKHYEIIINPKNIFLKEFEKKYKI